MCDLSVPQVRVPPVQLIGVIGGNLGSVQRCLERLTIPYRLVLSANALDVSAPIILPGVGAFGAVMQQLHDHHMVTPLKALLQAGTPYLGICLGQQVLFDSSEEAPHIAGLGLLPGTVERFDAQPALKIPQVGWNALHTNQPGWPTGAVYFVNSYIAKPINPAHSLYTAEYGGQSFCAAVQVGHLTGFQFHPEKSSAVGAAIMTHWAGQYQLLGAA
jgi:imidazole glycerol phosphate synthase glutamine amidotransferase subunit